MYEKLTDRARVVLKIATEEALNRNSEFMGSEHILIGLVKEGGGVAAKVLKNLGVVKKDVIQDIDKLIPPSMSPTVTLGQLPFSPRAKRMLEFADKEALSLGHEVTGTEHILLGIMKEIETIAFQVLSKYGLDYTNVRNEVITVLGYDAIKNKKEILPERSIFQWKCARCGESEESTERDLLPVKWSFWAFSDSPSCGSLPESLEIIKLCASCTSKMTALLKSKE